MRLIATAEEIRSCDREAIKDYGIPGIVLMENAARGTADAMEWYIGGLARLHTLIVCGRGNNGGDGFALARHLFERGCRVTVASLSPLSVLKGDAAVNAACIRKMSRTDSSGRLSLISPATLTKLKSVENPDVVVDAVLGTGFKGKLKPALISVIEWMNDQPAVRVAIDIPSGIDADTGAGGGASFRADYTCTMGLVKRGLLFSPGSDAGGQVILTDIQIPPEVFRRSGIKTFMVEKEDVRALLPERESDVHKYRVGKVFVIAGSTGMTGAAALTSISALRSGAGAVVLGIPGTLNLMMEKKLTEVMTLPLKDNGKGELHKDAWERIKEQCEWADVIAAGPGLSRSEDISYIITRLALEVDKPLVLDADALNALSGKDMILKRRKTSVILTPHTGEFTRLSGIPAGDIAKERIETARRYARSKKVTLVLKGGPSLVASQDGSVYINETGNPGMATAGAGDVLTGIIAGLRAQGLSDVGAAYGGVYLHGAAGDRAREKFGEHALTAGDIMKEFLKVLKGIAD
jgi:ADP-dependent NAD(P)H-hydrate dehydratase / NAD(P)H-hydrate epimerase